MAFIMCLAHYCDTHGPTPLMVTEALPVGCTSCFECDNLDERRPSSGSRSLNPADGLAAIALGSASRSNSTSEQGSGAQQVQPAPKSRTPSSTAVIETPPESPRVPSLAGSQRRDSSFRKTYDENDKLRAIPCENCALTMPKQTKEGSPSWRFDSSGPILRTRKTYERIYVPEQPSPPKSESSSSDSDNAITTKPSHRRTRSRTLIRVHTSSSNSSFNSTYSHEHHIDYTSSHEPLSPSSFSLIRQSCLRTLSCETIPPSSNPNNNPPTSPFITNQANFSTSGGPIFFGDPLAGYTTAFVFRLPDPSARGRRRIYALMALSTHRERTAMSVFDNLSSTLRNIASWIQALAEAELERSESASPRIGNGSIKEDEIVGNSRNNTPTSSFLSGGRNRGMMDGKYMGMGLRARGLAELVGMPDFFFELHKKFVMVLVELGMLIG